MTFSHCIRSGSLSRVCNRLVLLLVMLERLHKRDKKTDNLASFPDTLFALFLHFGFPIFEHWALLEIYVIYIHTLKSLSVSFSDYVGQRGDRFFLCIDGERQSYKTGIHHQWLFPLSFSCFVMALLIWHASYV